MTTEHVHDFGVVDEKGDGFEFSVGSTGNDACRLVSVVQTERGPRRTEVAVVPGDLWRSMATAAVKELVSEMREDERDKKAPALLPGLNRLSPLVGRELGVLLIPMMEDGAASRADAMLHAWRELAREERWWLYAKAAAPGQRAGAGWRRALFHALSEVSESRSSPPDEAKKKNLSEQHEALVAEARLKNHRQLQPADSTAEPAPSTQVQPQSSTGRRKAKTRKTPEDEGQMSLF